MTEFIKYLWLIKRLLERDMLQEFTFKKNLDRDFDRVWHLVEWKSRPWKKENIQLMNRLPSQAMHILHTCVFCNVLVKK